jgi:glycosyltransferase
MISIITPVYNSENTILRTLNSINTQEIKPVHYVIDGGSKDNSLKLIKRHSPQSIILSERDNGIYDAMNKGISMCSSEIIGILNADDYFSGSDVIKRVLDVFQDPSVDACYGDLIYFSNFKYKQKKYKEKIVRYWKSGSFSPRKFYWGWMPPHPTFFVRRRVYEKYGLFNLDLGSAADYELMLRFLLRYRINVKYIPEVLVYMRVGGASNESVKARIKANRRDRNAWEVNRLRPFPWTLALKPIRKIPQWFLRP